MSKRDSLEVRANRASQVVHNPEFIRAFETIREGIVNSIERLTLDGSADSNGNAIALAHRLQAALEVKKEFVRLIRSHEREVKREQEPEVFDPTAVKGGS